MLKRLLATAAAFALTTVTLFTLATSSEAAQKCWYRWNAFGGYYEVVCQDQCTARPGQPC